MNYLLKGKEKIKIILLIITIFVLPISLNAIGVGYVDTRSLNNENWLRDQKAKQYQWENMTCTSWLEQSVGYDAYVFLGKDHNELTKPLLIVEAFDPTNSNNLVQYFEIMKQEGFAYNLYNSGYDLVFLNFKDGSTDIRDNAKCVIDILNRINTVKTSGIKNKIIAVSMGGLVTRYALCKEPDGNNYDSDLFMTLDTPHQGANIPLGAQALIADIDDMANNLSSLIPFKQLAASLTVNKSLSSCTYTLPFSAINFRIFSRRSTVSFLRFPSIR